MGRYFFHLHECGIYIEDVEGRILASMDDAVAQAVVEARDFLAAEVAAGKLCLGCRIEVVEETSGRAIVVPFSSTVRLESAITEKPPALLR